MFSYLKDVFLGIYILVIAFNYSIYFIIQTGFGLTVAGSVFQVYSGVLAVISVLLFICNYRNIPRPIGDIAIVVCSTVVLLYYSTSLFYNFSSRYYDSYFLSMGVNFIPAVLTGAMVLKYMDLPSIIRKGLIPFILLYTIILGSVVFTAKVGVNLNETFAVGALSYQNISYYSAFVLGLNLYAVSCGQQSTIVRKGLIALCGIQLLMVLMAGGRGAALLSVVFILYFGLRNMSLWKLCQYVAVVFFVILVIYPIVSGNEVFQLGFQRIINFFSSEDVIVHDNRWIRWDKAIQSFYSSTIYGHGLGGVFYEVGFYSHNIFTDLLCEGGLLLMGIFMYLMYNFSACSYYLVKLNRSYEIMVVIFLCSFIMCLFSGYYLSETGLWLSMVYMLGEARLVNNVTYENESLETSN